MFADLTPFITASSKRLRKSQGRAAGSLERLGVFLLGLAVAALVPSISVAQSQPVLEEVIITSQK